MPVAPSPTFSLVPSPPAQAPTVGLLAALAGTEYLIDDTGLEVNGSEVRWEGGYAYQPEQTCGSGGVLDPCDQTTSTDPAASPAVVEAMPFVVWAGDTCSSFGWEAHDFQGRATRALLASESKLISREFWLGTQAKASGWPNRFLASADTSVISGGPYAVGAALALLEQAIADTSDGQPAMIHCTRQAGLALSELGNTFRSVSRQIISYAGTVVNLDAGNPGTGPDGTLDGGQWMYATLLPTVRRSPVVVTPDTLGEALDRSVNLIEWRADRLASVSAPPCTWVGIQVSLPMPSV